MEHGQSKTRGSAVGQFVIIILGSYGPSDDNLKLPSILVSCDTLADIILGGQGPLVRYQPSHTRIQSSPGYLCFVPQSRSSNVLHQYDTISYC